MALENYRIIEYPEKTEVDTSDYMLVDSESNGTNKYQVKRIITEAEAKVAAAVAAEAEAREAEDEALQTDIDTRATSAELAAETAAREADVTELKADFEQLEPGLSDAARDALLNCFRKVAWINGSGEAEYNALEEALNDDGSVIRIDTSELEPGEFYTDYPYFVSNPNRLVYVGTKTEIEPGYQYKVEFTNRTTDSIDVGVYAFDGTTLEKVQNKETISISGGDNQGWQLSNYTFIAGANQKLVWITFRKNAGDVPISAADISNIKITRVANPGIMNYSYQEILVAEHYASANASTRTVAAAINNWRNISGELNYQKCPVNKIKLKATVAGVITLGTIKKSDAVVGDPGYMERAHRKVTVTIPRTGEQEIEFEGFPVADDEYVCCGFNSWDDTDKTKTTATWTYGTKSAAGGYMYMQVAEPHTWVFWEGGTSMGINLYIKKRVYS